MDLKELEAIASREMTKHGLHGWTFSFADTKRQLGVYKYRKKRIEIAEYYWQGRPVDEMAMAHVRDFWKPYELVFPFKVEHKLANTFYGAAYWSKDDYALVTDAGTVYALRGKDRAKRTDKKVHPTFALLDNILAGGDGFPDDLTYSRGRQKCKADGLSRIRESRQKCKADVSTQNMK